MVSRYEVARELAEMVPPLFSQADTWDPLIWARLVSPSGEEWFVYEFDGDNRMYALEWPSGEEVVMSLTEAVLRGGQIDHDWVPIHRYELLKQKGATDIP